MIRRSHFVAATALVVVLVGGFIAFAQGPGFGGPRGRGPAGGPGGPGAVFMFRELGLTEAQQQQVRQIGEQFRTENQPLMDRIRRAEEARRDAVEAIPVDESRIRAAMQQLSDAQIELAVRQARLHSDIYALLTPEQQQQAQKLRAERDARVKERQERLQQRTRRPQA
jgi:protein CpxP